MEPVPDFFFWTVWSSEALAAGASASTPDEVRTAWRGCGGGYDPKALAERSRGNAFGGGACAPLRFPAPPRQAWRGMFRCRACPEAKRRVRCSRRGRGFCRACAAWVGSGGFGAGHPQGFDAPADGSVKTDRPLRSPWSDCGCRIRRHPRAARPPHSRPNSPAGPAAASPFRRT